MKTGLTLMAGLLLSAPLNSTPSPARGTGAATGWKTGRLLGTVAPRSALQMRAAGITSPFSIGTETTDRNFSIYENWRHYLGPLGIPAARLQTGWADVERRPGVFDYAKLDRMVRGMKADGVEPWMDLAYGNALYEGGGGTGLGAAIPVAGTAGMRAWENFVRETVRHFSRSDLKVAEWQIWNEPDGGPNPPEAFAAFAAATARIVKQEQPAAKILLAGFTSAVPGSRTPYALTVMRDFSAQTIGAVPSSDVEVVYHPYNVNPDQSYGAGFETVRAAAAGYGYRLRQGENGTNSTMQSQFALSGISWTEAAQAKWALRRLLGDFHRGMRSNLFTLTDLHYKNAKNNKGLLLTGAWSPQPPTYGDQTVVRPKLAYRAVQNLAAIFDERLKPVARSGCVAPNGYTVQVYRLQARALMAVWRSADRPGEKEDAATIQISCVGHASAFLRPGSIHYVDLLTGEVRGGDGVVRSRRDGFTVSALRVYDGPVLLADVGIVPVALPRGRR